jgi:phytanoyl-CoA hydroxylase
MTYPFLLFFGCWQSWMHILEMYWPIGPMARTAQDRYFFVKGRGKRRPRSLMNAISPQSAEAARPVAAARAVNARPLTPAERFVRDGYYIAERLVGESEIQRLADDILKITRGGYPLECLKPVPPEVSDDEALRKVLCIHQPHFISPVIREFTHHPGIVDILSQITAAHLPQEYWDGSVKCMQSMFFVKGPGRAGQAWHQDEHYIPTRDRSLLGAWIAVDDANIENGCLWVLPGSHRRGVIYPVRDHKNPDFDFATEAYGFGSDAAEVAVEVPRGSVVFFNGYLLHRSKPNRSKGYRRALVNHYMSAQSLLPWGDGCIGGERFASADNRRVILVSGKDPYVEWKPVEEPKPKDLYLRSDGNDA